MLYISNGPGDLVFSTWRPDEPSPSIVEVAQAYVEMADGLERAGAVPLLERLFCELNTVNSYLQVRNESAARLWPLPPTVVEGAPCEGRGLAGIHIVGVRNLEQQEPQIVMYHETTCGIEVAGSDAVYLALADIGKLLPRSGSRSPAQETRDSIRLAEDLLTERAWSFHDVRRTWFYLHEILDWYGDFNCARNQEYDRMGLARGGSCVALPASTGISAHNPRGAWCVFDLLAVRSHNGRPMDVRRLTNPHQSEAPEYGSAFSRGLVLPTEKCRVLLVSGTAAIDDRGRSVHVNDFQSQTESTIDAVAALIGVGGGEIDDVCQATAFIKRREDISELKNILARRGLDELPVVYTIGDVCRDELLFELEATAVVQNNGD